MLVSFDANKLFIGGKKVARNYSLLNSILILFLLKGESAIFISMNYFKKLKIFGFKTRFLKRHFISE